MERRPAGIPPMAVIAFVIIALVGMLLVMIGKNSGGEPAEAARSQEIKDAEAELKAMRGELNRKRMEMGLRPLEGGGESVSEISKRIKRDAETMVALAGSFQTMLAEKDAEVSAKNAELIRSEQLRQTLTEQAGRSQMELQKALVAAAEGDRLRAALESASAQRDALVKQLATVRGELAGKAGGMSGVESEDLKRQVVEAVRSREFFEKRVAELEAELAKTRLFAKSENELFPAAQELFRSLRNLEGSKDSDQTTAYSAFGTDLGANVLRNVHFATGSGTLSSDEEAAIGALIPGVPDGDLVLVVGYASVTGNPEQNRTLSSERATAVARHFADLKRPGQQVQAVYLGQTERFSSRVPESNQMVEVWRIRKR